MTASDCLFCKIVAREIPSDVVAENESCIFCDVVEGKIPTELVHEDHLAVAFHDISPKAPVHVLVVPKRHVASLGAAADEDVELLGQVLLLARQVARREGIDETGFRAVTNTGADGGQDVLHLHVHVLGGRELGWPPG